MVGVLEMRNKERIKPFLEYIESEWNKSPDQRFGQLLINLGIVNDDFKTWNDEITDYPIPFEYLRKILSWGKHTGTHFKPNDRVSRMIGPIPIYSQIPIFKLTTPHIKSILTTQSHIKGEKIEKILKEELKWRKKKGKKKR
jgi:hypothetical protein